MEVNESDVACIAFPRITWEFFLQLLLHDKPLTYDVYGPQNSSRREPRTPYRRSRRLAALYSVTKQVSKEKVVIEVSDDLVQKEDTNLEQNEAEPVAEVGGGVDLPKNDVYDALWAMLDVESDNEAA
ncbi:hypothetical protein PIB30_082508 [Stylosanthes scabra]|uniref:Uncharacterized protein n=1 Tax=Stylosanthes scabra TaxID=79078 RepID=A0ABU6XQ53_9FABA|nr:hypothetical protein [Stylosanthes scabra]